MTTGQALAGVLDETIAALAALDQDALLTLEERAAALAESRLVADDATIDLIRAKRRVLEQLLGHSESNLNMLSRLHERYARDAWER